MPMTASATLQRPSDTCDSCRRQLPASESCPYCTTSAATELRKLIGKRILNPPPDKKIMTLLQVDTGRHYRLDSIQFKIGRGPRNHAVLSEDLYVARHHAFITYEDGRFWIEDLGSKNGTLVNSAHIVQREELSRGDTITIGQTDFMLV